MGPIPDYPMQINICENKMYKLKMLINVNIFIRIRTKESTLHHFQVHFYFILNKAIRQYLDYLIQLQKTIVDDLSLIPLNNL